VPTPAACRFRSACGLQRLDWPVSTGCSHRQGFAFGVRQAEAAAGIAPFGSAVREGESTEGKTAWCPIPPAASDIPGIDDVSDGGSLRVLDRVGRAARQDAHSVERDDGAGPGWAEPGVLGTQVIQIVPQMKILVAIEAVDGRKGIDSLVRLCQEKLQEDPFSGCVFVFRSRSGTAIRLLSYDGQGYWLAQKRLSKGRFVWWPEASEPTKPLEAYEVQLLMAAGDMSRLRAAPMWRRVKALK
jgi:transposase